MSKLGQIKASLLTDQGQVRGHNEDFVTYWEPVTPEDEELHGWIYVVADGVGGAEAGEVASQYASEQMIEHYLATSSNPNWSERLLGAMYEANKDLRQLTSDQYNSKRMATTMVCVVIQGEEAIIGNVGDSRGYHWRNGRFQQVTKDQSLVAKLLEEGAISEQEALHHPRKNVILYSIGSEQNPQIDSFNLTLQLGDMLLLCSDGLTRHVSDEEIGAIIADNESKEAAEILIDLANQRGGEDNISVAVIHYQPSPNEPTVPLPIDSTITDIKTGLWVYTFFLAFIMSFLIIILWLYIQN